jgi:hypothetical protein
MYDLVVGPGILDLAGNALDQDGDLVPGEVPDDQYSATFIIKAPRVLGHTPAVRTPPPVQSMRFDFDLPMDGASFSLAHDIVSFTGPGGSLTATGYRWADADTLEVMFDPQWTMGAYKMVIGPEILDLHGNAMDQDHDLVPGEVPDDQYAATFTLAYSGTLTQDTTWGPEHGPILVGGPLTVASGATLTIQAGTVIKFWSSSTLYVQGTLNVLGTPEEPVVLTSWRDDTAGGDTNGDGSATTPVAGDWEGIGFFSTGGRASIDGAELRYASNGLSSSWVYINIDLRNSKLLHNGAGVLFGGGSYAELLAENVVIAGNGTGSVNHGDSQTTFRNVTIVDNWQGIHLGDCTLNLENTVLAFNGNGLLHVGPEPFLQIRNSDLYNPAGANIQWAGEGTEPHPIGIDGNVSADPLFVDRNTGNYELGAGSPAVDAGRGTGAPTEDILGWPRHDDLGMPNVGTGYPSYVDMGAYERQEDTPAGDLALTYVLDPTPESVSAGDSFSVEWSVANVGLVDAVAPWQDMVYLSTDPYISADDLALETRVHNEALTPGSSYTEILTATVPARPGPQYVLVHTNADRALTEAVRTNNVGVSSLVLAVDVPLLELGVPATGTLATGKWNFYRFEGTSGRSVRFGLDATATSGSTGLYVRHSLPPTASQYDIAGSAFNQPDQEAKLLEPMDGTYYVGVYGQRLPLGPTSYTLLVELTGLSILSVSPGSVGNVGPATIEIVGDNFSPDDQIRLVAPDGVTQLSPSGTYYENPGHTFATFDLTGAGVGAYDVVVASTEGEIATLADAVQVTDGGGPDFSASLSMPGAARPGRVITVGVNYVNNGTSDLLSPLLTLTGPEDVQWQAPGSEEWVTGPEFRVLALSTSGPANVLRPGQSESIEVKVVTPYRPGYLELSLYSVGVQPGDGSEDSIDWSDWYSDETMIADLQRVFGDTWGEYVRKLGEIAAESAVWEGINYSAADMEFLALSDSGSGDVRAEQATVLGTAAEQEASGIEIPCWPLPRSIVWHVYAWDKDRDRWKDTPVQPGDITANGETAVVIHGNLNTVDTKWVVDMARALARKGVANVLGVDWGSAACTGLLPTISAAYIPLVAQSVYQDLLGLPINPGDIHIIGHSHGAHIAGLIGRYSGGAIGRITALDPSEEGVHWNPTSFGGSGWGWPGSAKFVDSYKSSQLCGGETPWGEDNFLLVQDGDTWGDKACSTHGYAVSWYTETIRNGGGMLNLGYNWDENGWTNARAKITQLRAQDGPWKGLIRGGVNGNHVLEAFSQAAHPSGEHPYYKEKWFYPGGWFGGNAGIKKMLSDLAAAVEMDVSNLETKTKEGVNRWKAAGKGTVSYYVMNNADNQSISRGVRLDAQMGNNMGFLGRPGPGPIQDIIWLSADDILDPSDYPLHTLFHDEADFLDTHTEVRFGAQVTLPGKKAILSRWNDSKLRDHYYIIVDAGDVNWGETKGKKPYSGELYPADNVEAVEITIEGEDLSAEAGTYPAFYDADGDGWVTVTLNGSASAPKELIDSYEWSVGVSGEKVDYQFPVGEHTVTLTVTHTASGNSDTDEATIVVKPKKKPPDGDKQDEGGTGIVTSDTPEDKFGPAGYDAPDTPEGSEVRYIPAGRTMDYRIEIWNKPDAPAPTQDAIIRDTLDPNVFDLSTFEFTDFGFLKWDVPLPGGQAIDTRVDLRPDMNLAVDVKATFDPDTGEINWWFHAVDPVTGEYPEDPFLGFLPPYNPATGFELGWVEFRVQPKAGLPSGTQIANQAFVEFDFAGDIWDHPAPNEGPWINTLDALAPTSAVAALPAVTEDISFLVSWSGEDEANGSGLADFTVYISDNGGPFVPWLQNITLTEATFSGDLGHTYAFYSRARDNAGNREAAPSAPDAQTRILGPDTEPPTTLISLSPPAPDGANGWYLSPVTVTLSAQDNEGGSGVAKTEYSLDNGSSWQAYSLPFVVATDGTSTVLGRSTDNAGNVEDPAASAGFKIDQAAPTVNVEVPAADEAVQDGITLAASANDATSGVGDVRLYVREDTGGSGTPVGHEELEAAYNPTSGNWEHHFDSTQLPDGYYVILAKGTDNAGSEGWSEVTHFSIRNWAVLALPTKEKNKAGSTIPVKFSLRIAAAVDPAQPFVRNEELTIKIYETGKPGVVLQTSRYGSTAKDYRIDEVADLYVTNFKTMSTPKQYTVEVWRKDFKVDSFTFKTTK